MKLIPDSSWGILTVFMEAENQSIDGKTAVAEVILRRTRLKYMSDGTITDTCLRPYQFSCWNSKHPGRVRGAMLETDSMQGQECTLAWNRAVAGSNLSQGAVLYLNPVGVLVMPEWATEEMRVASIGHHQFYTDKLPAVVHE
jgi:N-acetylmuramoyl-L-alanine amidase